MIAKKIKSLLFLSNSSISIYARYLGQTQPNISNKMIRNSWSLKDLLKLGEHTNKRVAFIDENDCPIVIFDNDDLKDFEKDTK